MAAEGAEVETQQKEETKRHTYPLVRVSFIIDYQSTHLFFNFVLLDK